MLLGITSTAAYGQRAYFVNTRSMGIQVYWTDWVDSLTVSKIDIDSVKCADYVTQEIWTTDTVVRLPLSEILSITFKTPPTEYQPGVVNLEADIWPYIEKCNDYTITVNSSIPQSILPKPGTKLCTTQQNDVFPAGFAGEVSEIRKMSDGIEIECAPVDLTDIFVTYYGGSYTSTNDDDLECKSINFARPITGSLHIHPEPTTYSFKNDIPVNASLKFSDEKSLGFTNGITDISATIEHDVTLRGYLIVERCRAVYATLSGIGKHRVSTNVELGGTVSYEIKQNVLPDIEHRIPGVPFMTISYEAGPFLKFDFDAGIKFDTYNEYTSSFRMIYSNAGNDHEALPTIPPKVTRTDHKSNIESFNYSGIMTGGVYIKMVAGIVSKKIANGYLGLNAGLRLNGEVDMPIAEVRNASSRPDFYEKTKNSALTLSFVVEPELGLTTGDDVSDLWDIGISTGLEPLINNQIAKISLLPNFSNARIERNDENGAEATVTYDVDGFCLFPMEVFSEVIGNEDDLRELSNPRMPHNYKIGTQHYEGKVKGLSLFNNYKAYPKISLFNGTEILASPAADIESEIKVTTEGAQCNDAKSAILYGQIMCRYPLSKQARPLFVYSEKGKKQWKTKEVTNWDGRIGIVYTEINSLKPETEYEYYFALRETSDPNSAVIEGNILRFWTPQDENRDDDPDDDEFDVKDFKAELSGIEKISQRTGACNASFTINGFSNKKNVTARIECTYYPSGHREYSQTKSATIDNNGVLPIELDNLYAGDNELYYKIFVKQDGNIIYNDEGTAEFYSNWRTLKNVEISYIGEDIVTDGYTNTESWSNHYKISYIFEQNPLVIDNTQKKDGRISIWGLSAYSYRELESNSDIEIYDTSIGEEQYILDWTTYSAKLKNDILSFTYGETDKNYHVHEDKIDVSSDVFKYSGAPSIKILGLNNQWTTSETLVEWSGWSPGSYSPNATLYMVCTGNLFLKQATFDYVNTVPDLKIKIVGVGYGHYGTEPKSIFTRNMRLNMTFIRDITYDGNIFIKATFPNGVSIVSDNYAKIYQDGWKYINWSIEDD